MPRLPSHQSEGSLLSKSRGLTVTNVNGWLRLHSRVTHEFKYGMATPLSYDHLRRHQRKQGYQGLLLDYLSGGSYKAHGQALQVEFADTIEIESLGLARPRQMIPTRTLLHTSHTSPGACVGRVKPDRRFSFPCRGSMFGIEAREAFPLVLWSPTM